MYIGAANWQHLSSALYLFICVKSVNKYTRLHVSCSVYFDDVDSLVQIFQIKYLLCVTDDDDDQEHRCVSS